jgi:coproporphyrinogen III oxidase-like Fe-S oxidoreductase
MGIQTFVPKEFAALGRGHAYEEIGKAIEIIEASSIDS